MFYIMNAKNYLTPSAKPNLKAIIESPQFKDDETLTVYVARREYRFDKCVNLFITSCGHNMSDTIGATKYTQDTGNGYRNRGETLHIDNIIRISKGVILSASNDIGRTGRRPIWVCK